MNPLQELHKAIDESNWDVKQDDQINKAFQDTNKRLESLGEIDLIRKSEIERWVFAFSKDPYKGLSFKIAGTQKLEDGSEVPFEWPDKKNLTPQDVEHIWERFRNCKNLFAKTEYGLVLYYLDELKENRNVLNLINELAELAKEYYRKSIGDDQNHYVLYFVGTLAHAFKIASQRKNDENINAEFEKLIGFTSEVHNNWNIKHPSTLRSIIDLTHFAIEYKKNFEQLVSLEKYLEQNYQAALEIAKSYNWGAIYICDVSQKLADSIGNQKFDWQTLKAEQFEAMVQPALDNGNMAAITFVENALQIYKATRNKSKVEELSKRYDEIRRLFRLGEIRQELPQEETQRLNDIIKKEVETKSPEQLVQILALTPMFPPLEVVQKTADTVYEQSTFTRLFPTSIIDKHGNTVEVFIDEEEKKKFEFWQSYDFSFQIGAQTLIHLFLDALKAKKISAESIVLFLDNSWIGKKYRLLYNGYEHEICPLDVVKPGIELYFTELEKSIADKEYPNFICCTDSLVTKSEYLLRFFCMLMQIPTFIDKQKGSNRFKMEKNIDELLRSLKTSEENPTGFLEEHRIYFKFILSQKVGFNLRHKISHGLMDAFEYNALNPLLMLTIILKLATYSFKLSSNEHNN
jgi:hypothetical protein